MDKEEAGRNVDPNHTESAKTAVLSPQSSTARTKWLETRNYKTGLNQRLSQNGYGCVSSHFSIPLSGAKSSLNEGRMKTVPTKVTNVLVSQKFFIDLDRVKMTSTTSKFQNFIGCQSAKGNSHIVTAEHRKSFMTMVSRSLLSIPFLYMLARNSFHSANHKGGRQRVKSIAGSLEHTWSTAREEK